MENDILGIDEKSSTSISGQIRSSSTRKSHDELIDFHIGFLLTSGH